MKWSGRGVRRSGAGESVERSARQTRAAREGRQEFGHRPSAWGCDAKLRNEKWLGVPSAIHKCSDLEWRLSIRVRTRSFMRRGSLVRRCGERRVGGGAGRTARRVRRVDCVMESLTVTGGARHRGVGEVVHGRLKLRPVLRETDMERFCAGRKPRNRCNDGDCGDAKGPPVTVLDGRGTAQTPGPRAAHAGTRPAGAQRKGQR